MNPRRALTSRAARAIAATALAACSGGHLERGAERAAPGPGNETRFGPSPNAVGPDEGSDPCAEGGQRGAIRGTVVFAGGGSPASFSLFASRRRPGGRSSADCDTRLERFPFPSGEKGTFWLNGLPPGSYTVIVSGRGFVRKMLANVAIEAAVEADLHAIVVDQGRTVSGRVLRADRSPAAGAAVFIADSLWADGEHFNELTGADGPVIAGADGAFAIAGVEEASAVILAEDPTHGRSPAAVIPAGDHDASTDLVLAATGALQGMVTHGGKPVKADVAARPVGLKRRVTISTYSDEHGAYRFARLAPGAYTITARLLIEGTNGIGFPAKVERLTMTSGAASLALDVPTGVKVVVRPIAASTGDQVKCALVKGGLRPKTDGELEEMVRVLDDEESARVTYTGIGGANALVFLQVVPGAYTLCGLRESDAEGDTARSEARPVACKSVTILDHPERQELSLELPAPVRSVGTGNIRAEEVGR